MKPSSSLHLPAGGSRTDPHLLAGWPQWQLSEIRALMAAWRQRQRYRRELRRLMSSGPHVIEDIGLLRAHAEREAAKPFWRP